MSNWKILVETVNQKIESYDQVYKDRLKFELDEIVKQGAETVWVNRFVGQKKFDSNPNGLLVPYLLGMVEEDPIKNRTAPFLNTVRASKVLNYKKEYGTIPFDFIKDPDSPDIDIDCLPDARDPIKQYAIKKYGGDSTDEYGLVCSVGTWQTYKFKSALVDTFVAKGILNRYDATKLTTDLPDDVDEMKDGGIGVCKGIVKDEQGERECKTKHDKAICPKCGSPDTNTPTIGKLLNELTDLANIYKKYPDILKYAIGLIGKIRGMGMHAGAMIITNTPPYGNVPLSKSGKNGYWTSMWTEGRNAQLSKFGYVKWDILGLRTLEYIHNTCKLICQNRGITFGKQKKKYEICTKDGQKHFIEEGTIVELDGQKIPVEKLQDHLNRN